MTEGSEKPADRKVTDAVRDAVERTMQATAGSAATTRERATELLDEVARRGRDAREEIARAGQLAGAEVARRGQEAGAGIGRRLETLERRLAEVEDALRKEAGQEPGGDGGGGEPSTAGNDGAP